MGIARDLHIDLGEARKTMKYSLGNYIATIVATAPITVIPIMIVNVTGASQQAYFYVAYSVAAFLFMVPDAIGASMFVEGSHERPLKATAYKSLRFSFVILAPMVLAIVIFGDKILLLFSPEYSAAAYELLLLLAISSLFYAVIAVYITVIQVQKNIAMVNYIRLAFVGLTIGLELRLAAQAGPDRDRLRVDLGERDSSGNCRLDDAVEKEMVIAGRKVAVWIAMAADMSRKPCTRRLHKGRQVRGHTARSKVIDFHFYPATFIGKNVQKRELTIFPK